MADLKKLVIFMLGCMMLMLMASCCFAEETVKDQAKCYTTWDDTFFYLAFKVDCPDVQATHSKPNAEISGDDAVSVYFDTADKRSDKITSSCFSMTVSAAGGAQFKAGTDAEGLKQLVAYTFKYGTSTQGTLNNSDDIDMGYMVEMAIPWDLLKVKSPDIGDMFGFNVIIRRHGTASDGFVSLSQNVKTEDDVLNPSKWSRLVIAANSYGAATLSSEKVLSAKYIVRAPLINGTVDDREWNKNTSFAMDMPLPKGFVYEAKYPIQNLVMTPYYYWFQGDARKKDVNASDGLFGFTDFPAKNPGPWMSYDRVQFHKEELADMVSAGIDVVLPVYADGTKSADRGLDYIIGALDELKAEGKIYPMVGMYLDASRMPEVKDAALADKTFYGMIKDFYTRVPLEYRAFAQTKNGQAANIVAFDYRGNASKLDSNVMKYCDEMFEKDFGSSIVWAVGPDYTNDDSQRINIVGVNPGYDTTSYAGGKAFIYSRMDGATYEKSWANALLKKSHWVICNSWNELYGATDICASRQYGRKYIEATASNAKKLTSGKEYAAEYLRCSMPKVIVQKQFAQAVLTLRNIGSQTWKASDGIALGYRWYRNGRFYGESKVKRPLAEDVAPGGTITVNIGVTSVNAMGVSIPEGNAEVRFELCRVSDGKWFSAMGDQPLMVPVTVGKASDWAATYLSCSAPVMVAGGQDYDTTVKVRNDGSQTWLKGSTKLGCKLFKLTSESDSQLKEVQTKEIKAVLAKDCKPGEIAEFQLVLNLPKPVQKANQANTGIGENNYLIRFDINNGKQWLSELGIPTLDKTVDIFESDYGSRIADSDTPSRLNAGQTVEVKVVVRNHGVSVWDRKHVKVGYHWYSVDGTELEWDGLTTPIPTNLQPGWPAVVKAKVKVPDYDGQYVLVWDVMLDGKWLSTEPLSRGGDILPVTVEVTNGKLKFVELTPVFDTMATSSDLDRKAGNFDGRGNSIPSELMLPDVGLTKEACWVYPSVYRLPVGDKESRLISFYYPDNHTGVKNAVACNGQKINFDQGQYANLYVLGASTDGDSSGDFLLNYASAPKEAKLTMNSWIGSTGTENESILIRHIHTVDGDNWQKPCRLFHYVIPLDKTQDLSSITLPKNPSMKIFAMTLEKDSISTTANVDVNKKK